MKNSFGEKLKKNPKVKDVVFVGSFQQTGGKWYTVIAVVVEGSANEVI